MIAALECPCTASQVTPVTAVTATTTNCSCRCHPNHAVWVVTLESRHANKAITRPTHTHTLPHTPPHWRTPPHTHTHTHTTYTHTAKHRQHPGSSHGRTNTYVSAVRSDNRLGSATSQFPFITKLFNELSTPMALANVPFRPHVASTSDLPSRQPMTRCEDSHEIDHCTYAPTSMSTSAT